MVVYDEGLGLEAYRFQGIAQPFPSHFHEYYVLGLVEAGERCLSCKDREYMIRAGDLLLFHPGDSHACTQRSGGTLDYRAVNLPKERMLDLAQEVTGRRELPGFSQNVICDQEAACYFRSLHRLMMENDSGFEKEECLLLLLSLLIQRYGRPFAQCVPECGEEIGRVCAFLEEHYAQRITLEQLCRCAGMSKSTLLRAFTKTKGVTPYRYLENVRVGAAKRLLEQGAAPIQAAIETGFSDQSHFTNYFSRFIGLAPGAYREIFQGREDENCETSN